MKQNNKREANTISIGDSIRKFFEVNHTKQKFDEAQLIASWEHILGKTIANSTKKLFVKNRVLFVEVNSGPLKHRLNASKDKIKQLFRDELKMDVVDEIVIM